MDIYEYNGKYYKRVKRGSLGKDKWREFIKVLWFYIPTRDYVWLEESKLKRME